MDTFLMTHTSSPTTATPRSSDTPSAHRRRVEEDDRVTCLVAACGVVAAGRGGTRSATVLLGLGAADAVLAPELLAWLEGCFHVYLEVLDRGSAVTLACVRITRPPDPEPTATCWAEEASRLLAWLARHGRRSARA